MNWHLVWTEDNFRRLLVGDFPREAGGLLLTLSIAVAGIVFSTLLGTALALLRLSRTRFLRLPAALYVGAFRNLPLLVLVFWAYFAPPYFGMRLSKTASVTIAIILFNSAYLAEIFRAGIRTVGAGQLQAAQALGLGMFDVLGWVIMPQAFRNMIPAITGRYVTIVKGTSLAFLVGLTDLTEVGREINNRLLVAPVEVYLTLLALYFVANRVISAVMRSIENPKRFNQLFLEF